VTPGSEAQDGAEPSRTDAFRAPVGTHDVLAPESDRWIGVVAAFAERAARFGYGLVVTPLFEHLEVFQRVGEHTDVVRKEMYDFLDKGGRRLALRPEGTAPVVRAYVQHRPTAPWKAWYVAPNFRYERPQKGRYRQHWQLGAEVLGVDDPSVDVEVISLADGFYRELGLKRVQLVVNSMGDEHSRPAYAHALREHFIREGAGLGEEFVERAEASPLRVLDSKRADWQDVIDHAPQLFDYLSDASRDHFEAVQRGLDALGIEHEIAPRLVRGFDYYTRTTFEFVSDALDAAQNAVGGGGRYDRLAEEMGGPPTPGIGFGMGVERILIACESEGVAPARPGSEVDVFVVDDLHDTTATVVLHELREAGVGADRAYGGRSVKAQFKAADRSGASYVVGLFKDEASRGTVVMRDLATKEQVEVPREQAVAWVVEHRDERAERDRHDGRGGREEVGGGEATRP
jgi:histidyl-tRNA synthetase